MIPSALGSGGATRSLARPSAARGPRHRSVDVRAAATLPSFQGKVYKRGDSGYEDKRVQYATTSHDVNGSMEPAQIVYVQGDDDIKRAIDYARENKLAIAVRTGGHQYTGASSTSGPNLQLDMTGSKDAYGTAAT